MSSIQRTLAVVLVAGFGLLLGVGGWLIYYLVRDALVERYDAKLRVEALTIITYTEQEREGVDVEFTDRYIREFDDDVGTQFFQLWYLDGKSIERSDSLEGGDLPRPEHFGSLEKPSYYDLQLRDGRDVRAISLKFVPHADSRDRDHFNRHLKVGLVVGALRGELDQTLASLRIRLIGAGTFAVLGALVLVSFALRKGLAPLREVADQAAGIDATTLQTRFPTDSLPAELRPICGRLNELLARLQASFERERRFSSDVAHELRTPIAELRSLSEVALKWPPSAEESRQGFDEALGIARRMESLVAALQTIARSESGETRVQTALVRLPSFLESIWESFAPKAASRGLKVEFELQDGPRVFSDPVLLESIFTNLFANAVEYASAGGTLGVRAASIGPGTVTVTVSNHVDNLTPDDVDQLFDRFWRKDLSRTDTGHSGLGLSLVRALAKTLGAGVSANLKDGGMLEIHVAGLPSAVGDAPYQQPEHG